MRTGIYLSENTIGLIFPKNFSGFTMHELLRDLPGVVYEYLIRKDDTRAFTFVSDTCKRVIGIPASDLIDDPSLLRQIIFTEDRPTFEESLQKSHTTKSVWNWEGRIIVDGKTRWIETRSVGLTQGEDTLRKGMIIDITERKQTEAEHELRYHALVESLPLGVGIHVDGKLVMANAFAHQLLKARPAELIGKEVIDLVHPECRKLVLERVKKVLSGQSVSIAEERFICLDGEVIHVETTAMPFTYKGLPGVQVIVRDITQEKRTREEIKINETFFTQLFNNIPLAVVMLDATGMVDLVNQGFSQMFGYHLDELKGRNLNEFIVPQEYQSEGIDINNVVTSNKMISMEAVRKHKQGGLVNVLLYGMPVRMEDRIIGIYGVYVDITELKRMGEELKIRNAELDNFVYKVSHDLRAPLSSILGLVNLAKMPGNTDSPYDYLKLIGDKVNRLDYFISDVLSHSKNLKLEVSVEPVDLKRILLRTLDDLSYLEGASEVQFQVDAHEVEILSDPWRISEIFRNLVSNAIKYRQLQGNKPIVSITIRVQDNQVTIVFTDNGIGITPENMAKIFEMFYRATEQSDGSGIGLYIVKNAVEKLNGRISVDSIAGRGTTFTIELPHLKA
jgi:PAS domain S-box-containing protein